MSLGEIEGAVAMRPLFRMALVKGSAPTVLLHLRRGAGLEDRDERGLTPLMLAAAAGRQDICSLLIAEGASRSEMSPDGKTASDLALRAGHHGLAGVLQAPAEPTPDQAKPAPPVELFVDFGDLDGEGWEAEETVAVGPGSTGLIDSVRLAQASLGRSLPDTAPDWSDAELVLPARVPERVVSPALRHWIQEALGGQRTPAEVRTVCRRLPGLSAVLDDAGVKLFAGVLDQWVQQGVNLRTAAERSAWEPEAIEAVEGLLHPRDSDTLRRSEIERVPRLDRATEQSMFRALEDSRRSVLRALVESVSLIEAAASPDADVGEDVDEDEPEADFVSQLLGLQGQSAEDVLKNLAQLDLDIRLAEGIIQRLSDRGASGAAGSLRLQLGRYLTARDRVVTAGLRWVEPIARHYVQPGLELGDLCQAGAIGLMRAAERFDPSFGYRFQTFATLWIRQGCGRLVADQAHTIRVPVHVQDTRRRFIKARGVLVAEGLASPTFDQIVARAELTPEAARRSLRPRRQLSLSHPRCQGVVLRMSNPDDDPMPALIEAQRRFRLGEALAGLEDRQADIIRRRFGLEGLDALTLEEVGVLYQLTRERIRQIEAKALKRLEKTPGHRQLRDLL